jgi:Ca2+-binding EF-hand superfamily protein
LRNENHHDYNNMNTLQDRFKETTSYWTLSRWCRYCYCQETIFVPNSAVGQSNDDVSQLKRLGLSDTDIQSFYSVFSQLDDDASGTIDHYEFSDAIGTTTDIIEGHAGVNDALFGTFDLDHGSASDGLDFREFVVTIWNYATYSESELARFAFFNLCKVDRSGTLSYGQVKEFLKMFASAGTSGNAESASKIQQDLLAMDTNGDQQIDLDEWLKFTNTHKRVMVPLLKAQSNLQQRVMGTAFWKEQLKDKEHTMKQLLHANMSEKDLNRALHANRDIIVGDEDDHDIHNVRSFRADETLVPFQIAPRPKKPTTGAYKNTLTSKELKRKVLEKEKETEGNPYAYKPQKKKNSTAASLSKRRRHEQEEASSAMMRVEAIRRKQAANDQRRHNLGGALGGKKQEKNTIHREGGKYHRATINRKILRRFSSGGGAKI